MDRQMSFKSFINSYYGIHAINCSRKQGKYELYRYLLKIYELRKNQAKKVSDWKDELEK